MSYNIMSFLTMQAGKTRAGLVPNALRGQKLVLLGC